jgi:hypothetical protein
LARELLLRDGGGRRVLRGSLGVNRGAGCCSARRRGPPGVARHGLLHGPRPSRRQRTLWLLTPSGRRAYTEHVAATSWRGGRFRR